MALRRLHVALSPVLAAATPIALGFALVAPDLARATVLTSNNTPFPSSRVIVGARWTSPRYGPPRNQTGDVLPTIWADDNDEYTMIDDGGTDAPPSGAFWRQSVARITGSPPSIHFSHVGDPKNPPPHTFAQIIKNRALWAGPLGPVYSSGLVAVNHVFFATQQFNWKWGANGLFTGLQGIAFSIDHGAHWTPVSRSFPAPLGNLNWIIRGRGGTYPDGWVYAIASEREFNASRLIMGRARADAADLTNPDRWQWVSAFAAGLRAEWSSSFAAATPILSWPAHITYPQMAYDSHLRRYLLTFSYSYAATPPGIWRNGAELVMLEGPHPWGPFTFVAREPYFGPSNGYSASFPVAWMSRNGRDLWMKWAANFDGCSAHLDCSGGYGFNYRRLHLTVAGKR
jgi:hypothetical protein